MLPPYQNREFCSYCRLAVSDLNRQIRSIKPPPHEKVPDEMLQGQTLQGF